MRSQRLSHNLGIQLLLCVIVSSGAAACSSDAEGSGDPALVVEVLQDAVTVENKTGSSLMKGEISVVPQGIPRPYVALLPHMSSGTKRTFPLSSFRMSDGSPFRRDIAKGRSVKITAVDLNGKSYERQVPFK